MTVYRVTLDDQLITETEREVAAWATYRAQLRRVDLRAERPLAMITADGDDLHSVYCDGRTEAIEIGTQVTPNDVLKSLMAGRYREPEIKQAAADAGYPVSNSKIQGWLAGAGNRRYQRMTLDELYLIVNGLP